MRLKSQKGSITIFVLVALLFYTAFLLLMYAANTNKFKTISEKTGILQGIYERNISNEKINDIYNKKQTEDNIEEKGYIKKSADKDDSYVGYYADINADGIVDGIIFADLLTGSIRENQVWGTRVNDGSYTLPNDVKKSNVKSYCISQENYNNSNFGSHPIITPKNNIGKSRFYVMQLSDFIIDGKKTFYYYKNAYNKMNSLVTSKNFGAGKQNTKNMIDKWNAAGTSEGYLDSEQDDLDIWKYIQNKYNEGWFLPSSGELSAFANELDITTENYKNVYGLQNIYWSSSQSNSKNAYYIYIRVGYIDNYHIDNVHFARLVTTF